MKVKSLRFLKRAAAIGLSIAMTVTGMMPAGVMATPVQAEESENVSETEAITAATASYYLLGSDIASGDITSETAYTPDSGNSKSEGKFTLIATNDKKLTGDGTYLKTNGAGSKTYRSIKFTTGNAARVTMVAKASGDPTTARKLGIYAENGTSVYMSDGLTTTDTTLNTEKILEANTTYYVYATGGGISIKGIYVLEEESGTTNSYKLKEADTELASFDVTEAADGSIDASKTVFKKADAEVKSVKVTDTSAVFSVVNSEGTAVTGYKAVYDDVLKKIVITYESGEGASAVYKYVGDINCTTSDTVRVPLDGDEVIWGFSSDDYKDNALGGDVEAATGADYEKGALTIKTTTANCEHSNNGKHGIAVKYLPIEIAVPAGKTTVTFIACNNGTGSVGLYESDSLIEEKSLRTSNDKDEVVFECTNAEEKVLTFKTDDSTAYVHAIKAKTESVYPVNATITTGDTAVPTIDIVDGYVKGKVISKDITSTKLAALLDDTKMSIAVNEGDRAAARYSSTKKYDVTVDAAKKIISVTATAAGVTTTIATIKYSDVQYQANATLTIGSVTKNLAKTYQGTGAITESISDVFTVTTRPTNDNMTIVKAEGDTLSEGLGKPYTAEIDSVSETLLDGKINVKCGDDIIYTVSYSVEKWLDSTEGKYTNPGFFAESTMTAIWGYDSKAVKDTGTFKGSAKYSSTDSKVVGLVDSYNKGNIIRVNTLPDASAQGELSFNNTKKWMEFKAGTDIDIPLNGDKATVTIGILKGDGSRIPKETIESWLDSENAVVSVDANKTGEVFKTKILCYPDDNTKILKLHVKEKICVDAIEVACVAREKRTIKGAITADKALTEGLKIKATSSVTGLTYESPITIDGSDSTKATYSMQLPVEEDSQTYTLAFDAASGYVIDSSSTTRFVMNAESPAETTADLTVNKLSTFVLSGDIEGIAALTDTDRTDEEKIGLEFTLTEDSAETKVVPQPVITLVEDHLHYEVSLSKEEGVKYNVSLKNADNYKFTKVGETAITDGKAPVITYAGSDAQAINYTAAKKDKHKVTLTFNTDDVEGVDSITTEGATFNFTSGDYKFSFTNLSDIQLREGIYTITAENLDKETAQMPSVSVKVENTAVSKTIDMEPVTSWDFACRDDGDYFKKTINNTTDYYKGLVINGTLKPNGAVATANSSNIGAGTTITIPVYRACTVTVEAYSSYGKNLALNGTDGTGDTLTCKPDAAGNVVLSATTQSYIKSITVTYEKQITIHEQTKMPSALSTIGTAANLTVNPVGQTLSLTNAGGQIKATISPTASSYYAFEKTADANIMEADIAVVNCGSSDTNGAFIGVFDEAGIVIQGVRKKTQMRGYYTNATQYAAAIGPDAANKGVTITEGETIHCKVEKTDDGLKITETLANGDLYESTYSYDTTELFKTSGKDTPVHYGFIVAGATLEIKNLTYKTADGTILYDQNACYDPEGKAPVVMQVTAQADESKEFITVNWTNETAGNGDGRYVLQVSNDNKETWEDVNTDILPNASAYKYKITELGTYFFRMAGKLGHKGALNAYAVTETSVKIALAKPVVTAEIADGAVKLTWEAVLHAASYDIYRYESTADAATAVKINTEAVTAAEYTDSTAVAGTGYKYFVKAVKGENQSEASDAVTAKVETPKFTVTFETDGGSVIEPVEVEKDAVVTKPETDPTKEGYIFKGWNLNDAEYDFTTPVIANITLKAVWESVSGTPEPTDTASGTPEPTNTVSGTPEPTNTVSGTSAPAATGTVSGTSAPAATGTVSGTSAPAATGTVSGTSAPAATGTVSGTSAPAATGTVSGTSAPAATGTVSGTTAPAATGEAATKTPSATGEAATKTPAATGEAATKTPSATGEAATKAPAATKDPSATGEAATKDPAATKTPSETEEAATKVPSGNVTDVPKATEAASATTAPEATTAATIVPTVSGTSVPATTAPTAASSATTAPTAASSATTAPTAAPAATTAPEATAVPTAAVSENTASSNAVPTKAAVISENAVYDRVDDAIEQLMPAVSANSVAPVVYVEPAQAAQSTLTVLDTLVANGSAVKATETKDEGVLKNVNTTTYTIEVSGNKVVVGTVKTAEMDVTQKSKENTAVKFTVITMGNGELKAANAEMTTQKDIKLTADSIKELKDAAKGLGVDDMTLIIKDEKKGATVEVKLSALKSNTTLYPVAVEGSALSITKNRKSKISKKGDVKLGANKGENVVLMTEMDQKKTVYTIIHTLMDSMKGKIIYGNKVENFDAFKDSIKSVKSKTDTNGAKIAKDGTVSLEKSAGDVSTVSITATITFNNSKKAVVNYKLKLK